MEKKIVFTIGLCFAIYEITAFATIVSMEMSKEDCITAFLSSSESNARAIAFGSGFAEAKQADQGAKTQCQKMETKSNAVESFLRLRN